MQVEDFSSGYYKVDMYVVPYDDGPVMQHRIHEYIAKKLYDSVNAPLMFRLGLDGNPYFSVDTESAIPVDRMAIPHEWFADNRMSDTMKERPVYILKPEYTEMLNESALLGRRFNEEEFDG